VEAVILAGGLGSRLWPMTARSPKHLLPVAGVPFLRHQLAKLAAAGVDHVVVATSYRAADFEPVLGDGSDLGLRLSYVTETEPLGTGGGLRHAAVALRAAADEPVVVLNGDQLSGHDLAAQVARLGDADGCLHLVEVADPAAYGSVPTDGDGRIAAFLEKSPDPVTDQVNAGCYVLRRRVIDAIPEGRVVSIERETFPGLLRDGRALVGYLESSYWRDVGTPAALAEASCDLVRGVASSPAYSAPPAERLIEDAAVARPDLVVGGSAIGPGAELGPDVVVDASVVLSGARIEAGAHVVGSVVGPGARIGPRTRLRAAAVGDGATVGADCELLDGVRVACDAVLPDAAVRFTPGVVSRHP
jgi:mannose-1-phosphate guanylyltransferase